MGFAKYKIDNREYCLQCSNMFGYDVIEEILSLIYIFIRNEECQKFIIWNQESDYYVGEYLNDNGARTFGEKDFVRYLNEEVLFDCNERAYIITDNIIETKNISVLNF